MSIEIDLRGRKKKREDSIEEKAVVMRYNPTVVSSPEMSPFKTYPELKKLRGVKKFMTITDPSEIEWRNRAVWYMVWLYSDDSVLNSKPPEPLADRKLKALTLAGFPVDKITNEFDERVTKELMNLGNQDFMLSVLDFLVHQKGDVWSEIVICEEQRYEAWRLRLAPVDKEDVVRQTEMKKKLTAWSKELSIEIRSLWDEFWSDHDDLREVGMESMYRTLEDRAKVNTGE